MSLIFVVWNPFCAAMEIGPQPHGVVRSNIYTAMKFGVQHMLDWVHFFNSGAIKHSLPMVYMSFLVLLLPLICMFCFSFSGTIFEGGFVDVFTMVRHIDYPRDSETQNITAAIHPQLQVQTKMYLWLQAFMKKVALCQIWMLLSPVIQI